jgi:outer membrane protein OmpA-like peptidoglycan-associated protein
MKRILSISVLAATLASYAMPATAQQSPPPAVPVFFQPWSAALDGHALSAISSAAKVANANPGDDVLVTGAADSVGSAQANVYMSETRAQVVADQLVVDGVKEDRIKIKGVGIVPSMAPVGTPAQFSRRVLIQVGG